ncbi:unnamed protein product [Orchesella dallaii]|uniref:Reverse transcriptase domain-containing protein n=1 Tax=Orchesella dallaii TaxID=48710 RepID=A0ABP1QWA3_9HEXA
MEDYRTACNLIRKDYLMVVIDVKDAYHMIAIHPDYQKYLKFRWKNTLYEYTCVPFGLNVAPRLYTKLMKPVLCRLRSQGHESVSFLDDALLIGRNLDEINKNKTATIKLYDMLGIQINFEKSRLIPSNRIKYLGFIFDSKEMKIYLPPEKKDKIIRLSQYVLQTPVIKIEKLAEVIGVFISACPAVRYGQLYTRRLEHEKILALQYSHCGYQGNVSLSDMAKANAKWWLTNIINSCNNISKDKFDKVLTTDASRSGWGAECNTIMAKGTWTIEERKLHINTLEILAIYYGILSLVKENNMTILCRTDSTTAMAYVNRFGGCRSSDSHDAAERVWKLCESKESFIFATYINTRENVIADSLSRSKLDETDFMLGQEYFTKICVEFGVPKVDLFASYRTYQVEKYVSFHPDPLSEAVDAFTIAWEDMFYAFPPFNMIGRVLRKIENDNIPSVGQHNDTTSSSIMWHIHRNWNLPDNVSKLLNSSCADKTWSQYGVAFKKWSVYCLDNKVSIYSPNMKDILLFLTILFESGLSYMSINTSRSMLSLVVDKIEGYSVGQHPLVVRLMKGVSRLKPVKSRYHSTWDVDALLQLFRSWEDNQNLDLFKLTLKTVGLLALLTAQRVQTLAAISMSNIIDGDCIQIELPYQLKTTSRGNPNPVLNLPPYPYDKKLCIVSCLKEYINVTKNHRCSDKLFISVRKPFKSVTSQTLSKWLIKLLRQAGIDERFLGHSFRHASTSKVASKGVCTDTILKHVGWSEKSRVFAKYYKKPIESQGVFSTTLLALN